jgi:hypothetical protein
VKIDCLVRKDLSLKSTYLSNTLNKKAQELFTLYWKGTLY